MCNSGYCVEVALSDDGERMTVSDSKQPGGPVLVYSLTEWVDLLGWLAVHWVLPNTLPPDLCWSYGGGVVWERGPAYLEFDGEEWDAFVASALAGEFDPARLAEAAGAVVAP